MSERLDAIECESIDEAVIMTRRLLEGVRADVRGTIVIVVSGSPDAGKSEFCRRFVRECLGGSIGSLELTKDYELKEEWNRGANHDCFLIEDPVIFGESRYPLTGAMGFARDFGKAVHLHVHLWNPDFQDPPTDHLLECADILVHNTQSSKKWER